MKQLQETDYRKLPNITRRYFVLLCNAKLRPQDGRAWSQLRRIGIVKKKSYKFTKVGEKMYNNYHTIKGAERVRRQAQKQTSES